MLHQAPKDLKEEFKVNEQNGQQPQQQTPPSYPRDTQNKAWGVLGFCIPLVGLILFLVWNQDRPYDAKYAGIGALIAVIAYVVFWILWIILFVLLGVAGGAA